MSLLAPPEACEFVIRVDAEGHARLVASKLDDGARALGIFEAAVAELARWCHATSGKQPGAVLGDGGPEVLRLRLRVHELQEEVANLTHHRGGSDGDHDG